MWWQETPAPNQPTYQTCIMHESTHGPKSWKSMMFLEEKKQWNGIDEGIMKHFRVACETKHVLRTQHSHSPTSQLSSISARVELPTVGRSPPPCKCGP